MDRGFKEVEGKLDLRLPLRAQIEMAQVFAYGASKYEKNNWLKGLKRSDIRAAQLRHDAKYLLGEQRDSESGLFHLAHKAVWALIELELYISNKLLDDEGNPLYWARSPIDNMSVEELLKPRFNKTKSVIDENLER